MTVAAYCAWWREHIARRTVSLDAAAPSTAPGIGQFVTDQKAAASEAGVATDAHPENSRELWYLKDWHLTTDFPNCKARAVVE